jgi:hypothetical protein
MAAVAEREGAHVPRGVAPGGLTASVAQFLTALVALVAFEDSRGEVHLDPTGAQEVVGFFVYGPLLLGVLGLLLSALLIVPVVAVAGALARGFAARYWALAAFGTLVVTSALWAGLLVGGFHGGGTVYLWTWLWIIGLGALPVAVSVLARVRRIPRRRIIRRTAGVTVAAVALTVAASYVQGNAEWLLPSKPPGLTAADYEGEWSDADGHSLSLLKDGDAVARDLPVERGAGVTARCAAAGTWSFRRDGSNADGLSLDFPDCGGPVPRLRIAGTRVHPELRATLGTGEEIVLRHR